MVVITMSLHNARILLVFVALMFYQLVDKYLLIVTGTEFFNFMLGCVVSLRVVSLRVVSLRVFI